MFRDERMKMATGPSYIPKEFGYFVFYFLNLARATQMSRGAKGRHHRQREVRVRSRTVEPMPHGILS